MIRRCLFAILFLVLSILLVYVQRRIQKFDDLGVEMGVRTVLRKISKNILKAENRRVDTRFGLSALNSTEKNILNFMCL